MLRMLMRILLCIVWIKLIIFVISLHQAKKKLLRKAISILILMTCRLRFAFGSHIVNLVNKFLMLSQVPLHVLFRFLFEEVQVFLCNILPNSTYFFHNIERRDVWVLFDNFGSCLKDIIDLGHLQLSQKAYME